MALLYEATLTPGKLELIAGWAPSQPWFVGDASADFEKIAAYRLDDPDGEVGVETLLVTAGGPILQVPLTYRAAALEGAEAFLIGTMNHSVLGTRWVYDASGDPVYLAAITETARSGGAQAELNVSTASGVIGRDPDMTVAGSRSEAENAPTIIRVLTRGATAEAAATVDGSWVGQPLATTLVTF